MGTHNFTDVLIKSLTSWHLIFFILTYITTIFISKKISKKTFKINNIIYLFLFFVYIIFSVIKASAISKLPPHDLLKDLCGLKYDIVKTVSIMYIPLLNIVILLAKLGDKRKKSIKE